MSTQILQTKLSIPIRRPQLVQRPRLVKRLDEGLAQMRKLSLLSAPAGFGKTTLVLEWVSHLDASVAWLSLDHADNDAPRFLAYLIAALQTIEANIGQGALAGLHAPQPTSLEPALASLINDILSTPRQFVLTLDDYHLIDAQAVHDLMIFLLDHLPANLHLVITSRDDPAFPLARLRIRDELTELRAADLAFLLEESMHFFNEVMALGLSREDVVALEERTEGWIAGLQVAGLSMRGRSGHELTQFINAFTGGHRYLLDFLAEEVLARQPAFIQEFLLQTSILDRLSGLLCDAVVERGDVAVDGDEQTQALADSQHILAYLDQANLFVIALDHERNWYRYHHLFREFLRHRLQQQHGDLVRPLHQRASRWFEENGFIAEAIDTLLAIDDFTRAARLVEQVTQSTVMQFGKWRILLAWMDALPDEVIRASPQLCLHYAWGLITDYRVEEAEARLQDADQYAQHDTPEAIHIRGQAAAVRSTLARLQGNFPQTVAQAQQALAALPKDDRFWRPSTTLNLATVYYLDNDIATAEATLQEAQSRMLAVQNFNFHLVAMGYFAQLQARKGDLDSAEQAYRQMLSSTQQYEATGHFVSTTGMAHVGLADLYRERNELERASEHLEQGLALGVRSDNGLIRLAGHMVLARVLQSQGDQAGALVHLRHTEELLRQTNIRWTWLTVSNTAALARLWIGQGELERAKQIVQSFTQDTPPRYAPPGYVDETQKIMMVRALIAADQPEATTDMLAEMAAAAAAYGRTSSLIEIRILQARAQSALGNAADASSSLTSALTLAKPAGYVRLFVDEGEPMAILLQQHARQNADKNYVQRLLAAFPPVEQATAAAPSPATNPQPLVDPLTSRELEVLGLIATGLTNQAIADKLFITHGTVRQHINRIYSKLAVKNRTQATLAAQELHLL